MIDGRRHTVRSIWWSPPTARCRELRTPTAPPRAIAPYPWGALWFVADDPRFARRRGELYQVVDGAPTMLGFLPTGHRRRAATRRWSACSGACRADRVDAWRAAGLAAWRDEVLRARAARRADARRDHDLRAGAVRALSRRARCRRGTATAIVFIGDAAHATSPQLGQGANLALIDAVALADCDRRRSRSRRRARSPRTPPRRRRHLGFYQFHDALR